MLFVVVLVASLFLAAESVSQEQFNKDLNDCLKEYKTDMEAFKANKIADDCFYRCVRTKNGLIDAAGKFKTIADLRALTPKFDEKFLKVYEECVKLVKGANVCADAKAVSMCISTKMMTA